MKRTTLLLIPLAIAVHIPARAQIYYPPIAGNAWQTTDPATLGWCTDAIPPLIDFLDQSSSKAIIVLKDGRIVIEHYFGSFTQDSIWYWASAGKSLTAFLVGKAQEEGFLDIEDPASDYLGAGWTNCTPEQEVAITIRNQLTMTSGLDDGAGDADCTDPGCLTFLAESGTRWAYHNAPYTLLDGVIAGATGSTLNTYVFNKLTLTTGLQGAFVQLGYNNVFFSKPRSMARFGLLAMTGGNWNGNAVMNDQGYFNDMVTPSQSLNEAYGYLWWLNGQGTFMLPGPQFTFNGALMPNAPSDAYSAMGKNGQICNVSPSRGLVVVRMGDLPSQGIFVPNLYNDQIWQYLNAVICGPVPAEERMDQLPVRITYDPQTARAMVSDRCTVVEADAIGMDGRMSSLTFHHSTIELGTLAAGAYVLRFRCVGQPWNAQRLLVTR